MLVHRREFRIEWGQCDPAGIVFYPQFFAMFDLSTAQLFERTGLTGRDMRKKYGIIGFPLVDVGANFRKPCFYDDKVTIECEIGEWGRSSFTVRHRILKGGALAVEGFEKRVWAKAQAGQPGIKPEAVPDEIRALLSGPASP
jgi:4-hydroxybenzoyl-CoA thioesterase